MLPAFIISVRSMIAKIPRSLLVYYGLFGVWLATAAMHIPDGYLSPVASLLMFMLVLPFWAIGVRKLRSRMSARNVPLVALMAAFSFVIMMFNIPLPGGTTGHAVGGALAAIILGPEIASMAITIALVIQAFLFGDGGILALGANCFNMAVVLPYVSHAIYTLFMNARPQSTKWRIAGAAVGGWSGLTVSALFAGFEFGIQPLLFHTAAGVPLYAPYPLSISIPAMVIPHALIGSVVEGLITAMIVAYLLRANPSALETVNKVGVSVQTGGFAKRRAAWIGLLALVILVPSGLLAPGTAWGEWGTAELSKLGLAFIPAGMTRLSGLWSSPLPAYNIPALNNASLAYIFSALLGIVIIVVLTWLFTLLLINRRGSDAD